MGLLFKIFAICIVPIVTCQYRQQQQQVQPEQHDFLDIQSPEFFTFTPSPLQQPDSLRSRPYYDFLSTLYRHDQGKSSLFTQYPKSKRDVSSVNAEDTNRRNRRDDSLSPLVDALQGEALEPSKLRKRAVVFRPLFVYRQQEIKKQRLEDERNARRY